jgi:hypothetical protein
MSRTYHHGQDRNIRVRGVRRPTDLRRLARVLIDLEQAQAEAEAEAEHDRKHKTKRRKRQNPSDNAATDSGTETAT